MLLRPVAAEDVPEVVALVTSVLAEFGLTFGEGSGTDEQIRALPGSYVDHGGAFFVAVIDGVVGCAGLFPIDAKTFELRKMYLQKDARGAWCGERAVEDVPRVCRRQGREARRPRYDRSDEGRDRAVRTSRVRTR